jgi:transposase
MFHRSGAVRNRAATRTRGELVPLPSLSPEQRAAALEKAAEVRKARAELKEQLKSGKTTLAAVLDRAEEDEFVGKLKVSAVLQALPGIGKIRATQIMEKLKIADSRRLRGLGDQQRKALLGEFAGS